MERCSLRAAPTPLLLWGGSGVGRGWGFHGQSALVATPPPPQRGRDKRAYFANLYAPPFSIERWNAGRACIRDSHALRFGYGSSLLNAFAISPTKLIWMSAPVSELPTKNSRPLSAPSI